MKARLTIFTEDKTSLFFNTLCNLSLYKNRAQIEFEAHSEDRECKIILGINRKKITVLRVIDNSDEDEAESEEDIFVLSTEKSEPSRAVISFDGVELYFSTDYFLVKIGKNTVEAELGCILRLGDSKTDLHKIFLKCVAGKTKE